MNAATGKKQPWASLAANIAFAAYHGAIGFTSHSWWFITLSAYYVLLSTMRFAILRMQQDQGAEPFITRFTGVMLMALAWCLTGTVILCVMKDRGVRYHEIVMITLALYAFIKIALGIINLVKAARHAAPAWLCLRNISLSDALVSICSLQRSMLVSFGDLPQKTITLFNLLTGSGVCIIVFILGLNLIGGKRILMAKSKIVQANEKIAESVVKGYKAIEKSVVDGYQKVEKHVVSSYSKMEDKFVERYLTHEGETIEEAKKRLKKEPSEK